MKFNSYFINPFYKDSSRHDNTCLKSFACLLCWCLAVRSSHSFTISALIIGQLNEKLLLLRCLVDSRRGTHSNSLAFSTDELVKANKTSVDSEGGDDEGDEKWPNRCSNKYFL